MRRWKVRARAHWLALQAAGALIVASARVRTVSQDRLVALLGTPLPAAIPVGMVVPRNPDARRAVRDAQRIGRVVGRVARLLPWHPTCLRQALATRWLLARRGIPSVLHLGVADVATMEAHAWVTVHGWKAIGERARPFTPVVSFFPERDGPFPERDGPERPGPGG